MCGSCLIPLVQNKRYLILLPSCFQRRFSAPSPLSPSQDQQNVKQTVLVSITTLVLRINLDDKSYHISTAPFRFYFSLEFLLSLPSDLYSPTSF